MPRVAARDRSRVERVDEGSHVSQHGAPLGVIERTLIGLESFVSMCGLAGGLWMATHPLTMMPLKYLEGTWFHTWRWPGIALFAFVGVAPALAIVAALRRHPWAMAGHIGVGLGLVAWIVVEALWVVVSPALQVTFLLVGVAILALAAGESRRQGVRNSR